MNLPTRGIGARTLEVLRAHARAHGTSLWQAAGACDGRTRARESAASLQAFLALIERLDAETREPGRCTSRSIT